MIEVSICDICNMPIANLVNFLVLFSFFFFLLFLSSFSFFSLLKRFVSCNLFLKKIFKNERKIKLILFSDFILHTFKKFRFKFYHSTKWHTFSFWPCYIRYGLLIIDQFPVEFSLLMPLLHLSLETTY